MMITVVVRTEAIKGKTSVSDCQRDGVIALCTDYQCSICMLHLSFVGNPDFGARQVHEGDQNDSEGTIQL